MQNETSSGSFRTEMGRVGDQITRLIHEGNIRHVVVSKDDRTVARFSVTVGVIGTLIAPYLAVIGVIVALAMGYSIRIEQETPVS